MKEHAIIGFNHGVLGLAENPALGPVFSLKTPRATPSVFWLQKPVPRAGFIYTRKGAGQCKHENNNKNSGKRLCCDGTNRFS